MATITVCDKCGKQSPKDGLFHANKWFEITIVNNMQKGKRGGRRTVKLLCEECTEETFSFCKKDLIY